MKTYVSFHFTGFQFYTGQFEKEVTSREPESVKSIPDYAVAFRFYDKDEAGNKSNYSPFFFLGKKITPEYFREKYPQLISGSDHLLNAISIAKVDAGGFYPMSENDIAINKSY